MINQKKYGVWMDSQHATIIGDSVNEAGKMVIIAYVKSTGDVANNSEKTSNNRAKMLQSKFFKEVSSHLLNATNIHVTGTGQVQEQFIHYLATVPQFKNTKTEESTSNKMSDEKLISFLAEKN